jgi:tetratricopeptide (TPR) repeat protein
MLDQSKSLSRISSAEEKGETATVVELAINHLWRFPDDWIAYLWYAMAKTNLAQYGHAEKAIRRAISHCPKNTIRLVYAQMGHLFKEKGELKKASAWYRRVLQVAPRRAESHIYAGNAAFKSGLLSQAEAHFRRGIRCKEGCIEEAYYNLGDVLLANRRYKEAIKCYREALAIDPKYTIAKLRLKDAEKALQMKRD